MTEIPEAFQRWLADEEKNLIPKCK